MGAIYEVVHTATRRRCALKVMLLDLSTDPDLQARFAQEATVTAEIKSDHLVSVVDAGIDRVSSTPFMVMDLLEGGDLGKITKEQGPLQSDLAVTLLAQAALALDKTHSAGIVHRDLKPENLFLSWRDDGTPHIRILDFGIAKIIASSRNRTQDTRSIGTPAYMPPEQILGDGNIGPSADLYAVAQIAFELLVGVPYWSPELAQHGTGYAFMTAIINGVVEPATQRARANGVMLPEAFDAWFNKATAIDPRDRFERPTRMIASLARALEAEVGGMKVIDVGSEVSLEVTMPASGERTTIPRDVPSGPTLASADHGIDRLARPNQLTGPTDPTAAQAVPPHVGGTTAGLSATPRPSSKRRWRVSWLLAAAFVGVAIGGGALWMRATSPSPTEPLSSASEQAGRAAPASTGRSTASAQSAVPVSTALQSTTVSSSAPVVTRSSPAMSPPRPSSGGRTTSRTSVVTKSSSKPAGSVKKPKDPTLTR